MKPLQKLLFLKTGWMNASRMAITGFARICFVIFFAFGIAPEEGWAQPVLESRLTINERGLFTVRYVAEIDRYYILWHGSEVTSIDEPVTLAMGHSGEAVIQDYLPIARQSQAFYLVQEVPIDSPLDLDGDGIDDVFELLHGDFLHPLNAADALRDSDRDNLTNLEEYRAGSDLTVPNPAVPRIVEISPAAGETMVSVTRHVIVRFNSVMDASTINLTTLFLESRGERIEGTLTVSPTGQFATFIPDEPLPPSAEVRITVRGDLIRDANDLALDADNDGAPGGTRMAAFRTLPLTRIPGTIVWGFVKDSFTEEPIVGATIRVDAFPGANAVTDENGRFELVDMPAPEFFVHIDGSTAINAPAGLKYPNVGKPFHSVPGQSVQIAMDGQPFDIYLPTMADEDSQSLSDEEPTEIGLGPVGRQQLEVMFPELDPSVWDDLRLNIRPGSAIDSQGQASTQASIIPVPPDRIPAPLPSFLDPQLVVSVQAGNATRFETPAPITFPNLEGLSPGAQSLIWSFNHAAGAWEVVGTGTVSADGSEIVSNPGVGIRAPGWHFAQPGSPAEPCPPADPSEFVLPELRIEGMRDNLFFRDTAKFTLRLANVAPPLDPNDPCSAANLSATPMSVEVSVLGPADEFLEGLESGFYEILPGDELELEVGMKPLLTPENIASATMNVLYGAEVFLWVTVEHPEQGFITLLEDTFYVYRLFDIADDKHADGVIEFEKTFVDGRDGVVRAKPILLNMPDQAKPSGRPLVDSEGAFLFVDFPGGATDEIWFDPEEVNHNTTAALMLHSPKGPVWPMVVRGPAIGPQRVFVSSDLFLEKAAEIENFPADPMEAYNFGVTGTRLIFASLDPALAQAIEFVDGSAGDGIAVNWALESDGLCQPGAPACAAWLDFDKLEFLEFAPQQLNHLEEEFRFNRIVNRSPTDAPPGKDFAGLVMNLDLMVSYTATDPDPAKGFGQFMANVLAHEIGHDLGGMHFRDFFHNYLSGDVMGSSPSDQIEEFGKVSGAIVKMALGIPLSGSEYSLARNEYAHFVPQTGDEFFNNNTPPPPLDAPLLGVFDGPLGFDLPVPEIVTEIDLGTVLADGPGGDVASVPLFLFSNGDHDLILEGVEVVGPAGSFAFTGATGFPIVLQAPDPDNFQPELSTRELTVTFDPDSPGVVEGVIRITSNTIGGNPREIPIRAAAVSPFGDIAVELPNNNVGGLRVNVPPAIAEDFAFIDNIGNSPLVISDAMISGGDDQFSVMPLQPFPITLNPGQSAIVGIEFDAQFLGLQRAVLEIHSNDPETPVSRHPIVGTGLIASGNGVDYGSDFVSVEFPFLGSASLTRLTSEADGAWTAFLAPTTAYHAVVFDPVSGLVAHNRGVTEPSGEPTRILPPAFRASIRPDSDGDGLPDDIEFAIGTSREQVDTDGDGIDDFTEIQSGLNPLDGIAVPTGVVARVELPGTVEDVAVADDLAYLAGHGLGLAVVDVGDVQSPVVLGRVDFALGAFEFYRLGLDPAVKMAAVVSSFGVIYLVDVSDPMLPTLHTILPVETEAFAVVNGLLFVGQGSEVHVYDLLTAQRLQTLPATAPVRTMVAHQGKLYALGAEDGSPTTDLQIFDISKRGAAFVEGGLSLATSVQTVNDVAVENGMAFVSTREELLTIDVQDTAAPVLSGSISLPDEIRDVGGSVGLALNGSGLGVYSFGSGWVFVHDFTSPTEAIPFVAAFEVPGAPQSVALHSGFALVADFSGELAIVNYLEFNADNEPPSATISSPIPDADPGAAGIQVEEGTRVPLNLDLADDGQVTGIELIVNGEVLLSDNTPPFRLDWIASRLEAGGNVIAVQVVARDNAGGKNPSNVLQFQIIEDSTAPVVLDTEPVAGAEQEHFQAVAWHLSEPVDLAATDLSAIQLTFLGPDGEPGSGDDTPITDWTIQERDDGRTLLFLLPGNLPAGSYQLTAEPGALRDFAGNPLSNGFVHQFTKLPSSLTQTYSGSLPLGGEPIRYEFNVPVEAWIFFDSLDGDDDRLFVELIDPLGKTVFSQDSHTDGSSPFRLSISGTYTLVLGDHSDAGGDFSFRLLDLNSEPELPLDQDIEGLLDPGLELDVFRLPALAGERFFLDLLDGAAANDILVTVDGPVGSILSANRSDLPFTATADGTLLLLIEASISGESEPVDYSIRMVTPETLRYPLSLGATTTGMLEESGELHIYRFDAEAGQRLFFDGLSADSDGFDVELYGPDGRHINASMSFRFDSSRPIILESSGRHRLEIGGESDEIGAYAFRLADLDAQPILSFGSVVEATIDPSGEVDFFQFNGVPGQRVFFDALSGGSAASWQLTGPDGSRLGGTSMSSDFSATPTLEGPHVLRIFTRQGEPLSYSFNAVLPETRIESLIFDVAVMDSLSGPGDVHEYTFDGINGQRLYFDALDEDPETFRVDLVAPEGGSRLITLDSDRNSRPFTITEDGIHRLVIGGSQDTAGDYAFRIVELATAPELPIGSVVDGRLEPRQQAAVFQYQGIAGPTLQFVGLTGGSQVNWDFYGPDDRDLGGFALSSDFEVSLSSEGQYFLILDSRNAGDPLDFSFQVIESPASDL